MDIDRCLNLEKRTGIKEDDIEEFLRKANDVEAAIRGMRDGTIAPEDVRVEGIESDEEKRQKEIDRLARLERQEVLRLQRKQEEKDRWWAGSELFVTNKEDDEKSSQSEEEAAKSLNAAKLQRYTADYSRWNEWVPSDPATVQEDNERLKSEEIVRNNEFERNNGEFCNQYLDDMKVREKAVKKKEASADSYRLKGNILFKKQDFSGALREYMEALKVLPYEGKTLLNIAQAYIKLKNMEDSEEFILRTLTMNKKNIKGLSRYAYVLSETHRVNEALVQINRALALAPDNKDLIAEHKNIECMARDENDEKELEALSQALKRPTLEAGRPITAAAIGSTGKPTAAAAITASSGASTLPIPPSTSSRTLQSSSAVISLPSLPSVSPSVSLPQGTVSSAVPPFSPPASQSLPPSIPQPLLPSPNSLPHPHSPSPSLPQTLPPSPPLQSPSVNPSLRVSAQSLPLTQTSREKRLSEGLGVIDRFRGGIEERVATTANVSNMSSGSAVSHDSCGHCDHTIKNKLLNNITNINDIDECSNDTNNNNNNNTNNSITNDFNKRKDELKLFDKMKSLASDEERSFKIYFRTSGTLTVLLKYGKEKCEKILSLKNLNFTVQGGKVGGCGEDRLIIDGIERESMELLLLYGEIVECLDLISLLVDEERAAKNRMVESGLIGAVKLLLVRLGRQVDDENSSNNNSSNAHSNVNNANRNNNINNKSLLMKVLIATTHFLHTCVHDDTCEKARTIVSTDHNVLPVLSNILGNILYNLHAGAGIEKGVEKGIGKNAEKGVSEEKEGEGDRELSNLTVRFVTECGMIGKALSFLSGQCVGLEGGGMILSLAAALHLFALSDKGNRSNVGSNVLSKMVESAVQALVGFSQVECVRPFFALPLPLSDIISDSNTNRSSNNSNNGDNVDNGNKKIDMIDGKNLKINNKIDEDGSITAVHVIFSLIKARPENTANCLGLLMNACLDTDTRNTQNTQSIQSTNGGNVGIGGHGGNGALGGNGGLGGKALGSVREIVAKAGGVNLGLTGVFLGSKERIGFYEKEGSAGFSFLSRCAGLLSRLTSIPSTLDAVSMDSTYRQLCRTITSTVVMNRQNTQILEHLDQKMEKDNQKGRIITDKMRREMDEDLLLKAKIESIVKYTSEEQSHLIRTLASLTKPSQNTLKIALEEKLVYSLLFLFPSPREELGEITPKSVTLTPKHPAPAILLGNAARCLLPFGDDLGGHLGGNGALLYGIRSVARLFESVPVNSMPCTPCDAASKQSTAAGTGVLGVIDPTPTGPVRVHSIERLICAMATCSDIRVRRNISIILAKGCKVPGVRDHVELFRGMQIMVELQKLL